MLAYDTETTGLNYHSRETAMFAFSCCDPDEVVEVHRFDTPRRKEARRRLEAIWTDPREVVVMHNAKFDLAFTEKLLGRRLDGHPIEDTILASNILQSDHPSHGLKELTWELAGFPRDDERKVRGFANYQDVPEYIMREYQERDAQRTMLLWLFFEGKLRENQKWWDAYRTEVDLVWATLRMEQRGVTISVRRCERLIEELQEKVRGLNDEAEHLTKRRGINLNRPEEVRWVLYHFLGWPVEERTKSGLPSTDKSVLLEARETRPHPIIDVIMKHRSWSRGVSIVTGYIEGAAIDGDLGTLHPSIHTCGAGATGRESCSNPNLQNVEKSASLLNPFPVPARKVFRPRPGCVNLHVDYAGIELRLLVHYSHDQELVDCINAGGDPHALAAEVFYGDQFRTADKERRKILRSAAKNANFAIPYGAGWRKVASTLGLPEAEAERVFRYYRERWPKLVDLSKTVSGWVRADGYVLTSFGRKIMVSRDKPYIGTNYLIQGTAADILKRAQVRLHALGVKLLLPIHDELVIEVDRRDLSTLNDFMRTVRDEMVLFPGVFSVPLDVEFALTTNSWEEKHEVQIIE